ncbi:MAG: D-alanyl-D-alanine carboxypeptidase family protein [Oscillospiraceae bacterium]
MVYAKNIDTRREPASLTKVMTCLLALAHGNLTDSITVSQEALDDLDPAGSSSGLMAGEVFTLEQLLYCLMIESANDAAPVIAEYVAGSEPAFVEMMNQKAAELGCTGTHFANTHGLHDEEHYTTARDLAKIMMAALEYEKFQEIYSADRYTLAATNLQEERILVTTNYLIDASITSDYYDERVIGGKTGFTTPAGRCVMCGRVRESAVPVCCPGGQQYRGGRVYVFRQLCVGVRGPGFWL